ncbi:MAG: helix-turn-helix domain-containing protein [Mogibacterium sp.]|nr:helix-turn-helix domain-containing protein [Mogibacterium sp.]
MTRNEAYDFLYRIAEGLSKMFGQCCETVVQEVLPDEGIRTVAIFNGHVSGRTAGSSESIYGPFADPGTLVPDELHRDNTGQLVHLSDGKLLKSSSYYLRGYDFTFILGINYDISLMKQLESFAADFNRTEHTLLDTLQVTPDRTLEALFEAALAAVGKPAHPLKKADRQSLIRLLDEKQFFQIRKSIPFLSESLGVSLYTIYKDLAELGLR